MKRYDSYKDSGVEWIGEIPSDWSKIKIKNTVNPHRKITYGIVQPGEEDPNGILMIRGKDYSNGWVDISDVFRVSPEIESPYSRSRVKTGDIVYTIVGGVGNVEMVPNEYDGSNLTQTTGRISVKDGIYPKWIYYSLKSELNPVQIKLSQVGSVIPGISLETLKNFIVLLPPLTEQQQIVSFLDSKTSQIDELIQKKERKIELLKEYRTSFIHQIVTKGLNPNVEMKDSGVDWIGEIPSHWVLSKVLYVLEFHNNVRIPLSSEDRGNRQGEYRYYGSTGIIDFIDDYLFDGEFILIGEDGSNLRLRTYRLSNVVSGKFWVNNHSHILRSKCGNNHYYSHLLELTDFSNYLTGSTQPKLTMDNLKIVPMVSPPLSEQQQIVEYLDEQTQLIDNTISIEEKRIELLKEYRQSLISEVVTGKIDVRVN